MEIHSPCIQVVHIDAFASCCWVPCCRSGQNLSLCLEINLIHSVRNSMKGIIYVRYLSARYTSASLQGFSVRRLFPGDRAEETEHLHHLKTWTVCPGTKCEYPTHMKYIIMKQSKGIWVMACTPWTVFFIQRTEINWRFFRHRLSQRYRCLRCRSYRALGGSGT